jgi:hypothetical protein
MSLCAVRSSMEFECKYCRIRWSLTENRWNESRAEVLVHLIQAEQCHVTRPGVSHAVLGVIDGGR